MSKNIREEFNQNPILILNRSKSCSTPTVKIFVPVLKPKNSDITPSPFHLFDEVFPSFETFSDNSNEETIDSNNSCNNIQTSIYFGNNTSSNNNSIDQDIINNDNSKDPKVKISILGKLILKRKYSQK